MHEDDGRAKVRIGDEAPLEGTWPQGFTKLGVWLACLAAVAVIGCFFGGAGVAFYAGGGLAIGTILVGLVAAVGGGIGVRSGPDGPRRLDHRAIQRGLWLVLAGFVLGAGVGIALAVAIASNWHS